MKSIRLIALLLAVVIVGVPSSSQALALAARRLIVIVQKVDPQLQEVEVLRPGKTKPLRFSWDKLTNFAVNQRFVDATFLRPGARVEIFYGAPFFGNAYLTKVVISSTSSPP